MLDRTRVGGEGGTHAVARSAGARAPGDFRRGLEGRSLMGTGIPARRGGALYYGARKVTPLWGPLKTHIDWGGYSDPHYLEATRS